jgi:hypothetical protein
MVIGSLCVTYESKCKILFVKPQSVLSSVMKLKFAVLVQFLLNLKDMNIRHSLSLFS